MATIAVGDEVALPQGHRAVLRWIGRIPGRAPIEYAGVEVLGPEGMRLGKHSGTYEGQQLFKTSRPGTGLFVSYTQLVGANVRSARAETPQLARAGGRSSAVYDAVSPSPRYHKPPLRAHSRAGDDAADSVAGSDSGAGSDAVPSAVPSAGSGAGFGAGSGSGADVSEAARLRAEVQRLRADRAADRKAFDAKRADFRETLRAVNERLAQYSHEYEARVAAVRDDYEDKLRSARRTSSLVAGASGSEVEEQRLALAAMQNKLVAERSEKQQEIDRLKRELAHVRQITGGADDLEALVADLSSMEQQLKGMRSKVHEVDVLQRELEAVRTRNAELELAVEARAAARAPTADTVSRDEYTRLEEALELRLLRESELEARNEQLQDELSQLRAAPQDRVLPHTGHTQLQTNDAEIQADAVQLQANRGPVMHTVQMRKAEPALSPAALGDLSLDAEPTQPSPQTPAPVVPAKLAELGHSSAVPDTPTAPQTPKPAADSWELTSDLPKSLGSGARVGSQGASPSASPGADETNASQFADLAAGRKDWCSLCERQGHSAIDCPFI